MYFDEVGGFNATVTPSSAALHTMLKHSIRENRVCRDQLFLVPSRTILYVSFMLASLY